MKKIILFLAMSLLFCACEPSAVRDGRRIYKAYFDYILKDPASFVVHSEEYEIQDGSKVHWKLDYGAKNGFGAMGRDYIEFTTFGDRMIDIDDLYGGELYFRKDFN